MAVGLAEKLALEGRQVIYLTPFESMAPYTRFTFEAPDLNRRLRELGTQIVLGQVLTAIAEGGVVAGEVWNDQSIGGWEVDSVVLVTQRQADDSLYRELNKADAGSLSDAGIAALYRIGDCVVPQTIADSIFSGHRLAREIDSPNPNVPLPYIRERRLVRSSEADFGLGSPALRDQNS